MNDINIYQIYVKINIRSAKTSFLNSNLFN